MTRRAWLLALALLLLWTQQLGLQHGLSHGFAQGDGPVVVAAADAPGLGGAGLSDRDADPQPHGQEAACELCLLLAALALAALPSGRLWRHLGLRQAAPDVRPAPRRPAAAAWRYQARAPPR